jgi:hypothetical protein
METDLLQLADELEMFAEAFVTVMLVSYWLECERTLMVAWWLLLKATTHCCPVLLSLMFTF